MHMELKRKELRQTERKRKEWSSGWRKLNVSETACVRKSVKKCVRNHEENVAVVCGVMSDVLKRVFEIVRMKKLQFQAGDDDNAPKKVLFQAGDDDNAPKKVPFQPEDDDNAAVPKKVLLQVGTERETDHEKKKGLASENRDTVLCLLK